MTNSAIYSQNVRWSYGIFNMTMPKGVLTINQFGRIALTLESGDILFSAPAALTKIEAEERGLTIVVGGNTYNVSSDTNDQKIYYEENLLLANKIQEASLLPADNENIISVGSNSRLRGIKARSVLYFLSVVIFCMIILFGSISFFGIAKARTPALEIGSILAPLLFLIIKLTNSMLSKRMIRTYQGPSQQDILMPGTAATGDIKKSPVGTVDIVLILCIAFLPLVCIVIFANMTH